MQMCQHAYRLLPQVAHGAVRPKGAVKDATERMCTAVGVTYSEDIRKAVARWIIKNACAAAAAPAAAPASTTAAAAAVTTATAPAVTAAAAPPPPPSAAAVAAAAATLAEPAAAAAAAAQPAGMAAAAGGSASSPMRITAPAEPAEQQQQAEPPLQFLTRWDARAAVLVKEAFVDHEVSGWWDGEQHGRTDTIARIQSKYVAPGTNLHLRFGKTMVEKARKARKSASVARGSRGLIPYDQLHRFHTDEMDEEERERTPAQNLRSSPVKAKRGPGKPKGTGKVPTYQKPAADGSEGVDVASRYSSPRCKTVHIMHGKPSGGPIKGPAHGALRFHKGFQEVFAGLDDLFLNYEKLDQQQQMTTLNLLRDDLTAMLKKLPDSAAGSTEFGGGNQQMAIIKAVLVGVFDKNSTDFVELASWLIGSGHSAFKGYGGKKPKRIDLCCTKSGRPSNTAETRLQNLAVLISKVCAGVTNPADTSVTADEDPAAAFEKSIVFGLGHVLNRLVSSAIIIDAHAHAELQRNLTKLFARAQHKRKIGHNTYDWLLSQVNVMPDGVKRIFGTGRRILPSGAAVKEERDRTMQYSKEGVGLGMKHDMVEGNRQLGHAPGVTTPILGEAVDGDGVARGIIPFVFHSSGTRKHLVQDNKRITLAGEGTIVAVQGAALNKTTEELVGDLLTVLQNYNRRLGGGADVGVDLPATLHLNRFGTEGTGKRIGIISSKGEALTGPGRCCVLIQCNDAATAVRLGEAIRGTGPPTRTAAQLRSWRWRSGADAGDIEAGRLMTAAGLTPDSPLANSVCTFFPYAIWPGKDDAERAFWFAKIPQQEMQDLERKIVMDVSECGTCTFYMIIIQGAGDGAHLRFVQRLGSASSSVPLMCSTLPATSAAKLTPGMFPQPSLTTLKPDTTELDTIGFNADQHTEWLSERDAAATQHSDDMDMDNAVE